MKNIKIERRVSNDRLTAQNVYSWPIWEKEVSCFPWSYDSEETCYFLEGEVVVTPDGGEPVSMGKGDLVTFPAGMSCVWDIRKNVKKHFQMG